MNTEELLEAGAIGGKMVSIFIFILLDVICNSIVILCDFNKDHLESGSINDPNLDLQSILALAATGYHLSH